MRKIKYLALMLAMLLLSGCTAKVPEETAQIFAMDTVMDFYAVGENASDALTECAREINRLEALLSRTREGSDVYMLNTLSAGEIHEDTLRLLQQSVIYAQATGGAFDITVAPLVRAWNITGEDPRVPSDDEIADLMTLVGMEHLHLLDGAAALDGRCAIDLGGIAKGYASDVAAQIYRDCGVEGGWLSLGGNVYAHGTKPDGSFWNVAIRDPNNVAASAAMVQLSNEFAVTSGGYQRYFTAEDGTVYQHIIDPATGRPAVSDLLSVTIVAKNGAMSDAYSTALYVMGEAEAVSFWRENRADFDMVLITADSRILYTPGLTGRISCEEGGAYELCALT